MNFFSGLNMSSSGMSAEQMRMEAASQNISAAHLSRRPDGRPSVLWTVRVRQAQTDAAVASPSVGGVEAALEPRPAATRLEYDPDHPDADGAGMVAYPDVRFVDEMVSLMDASRCFEANATAFIEGRNMLQKALDIGRAG
jgi:flagellar basal-body rod protein FlgC